MYDFWWPEYQSAEGKVDNFNGDVNNNLLHHTHSQLSKRDGRPFKWLINRKQLLYIKL